MAGDEERAKAEKLAAAKKRLEQLKKKKAAQGSKGGAVPAADPVPTAHESPEEAHPELDEKQKVDGAEINQDVGSSNSIVSQSPKDQSQSSVGSSTAMLETQPKGIGSTSVSSDPQKRLIALQTELDARVKEVEVLQLKVAALEVQVADLLMGDTDTAPKLQPKEYIEANLRLEIRVKELETQLFETKSGQWRQGRSELQEFRGKDELLAGDTDFDDIDLSSAKSTNEHGHRGQGIGGFLADGFSALTGANPRHQSAHHQRIDSQLDDDLDDDLLEAELMKAKEDEARKRVERIREVKKGLSQWKGWRLDLVNDWGGGRGAGEIFEV